MNLNLPSRISLACCMFCPTCLSPHSAQAVEKDQSPTPARPAAVPAATRLGPPESDLPNVNDLLTALIKAEHQSNGDQLVFNYGQAVRDPVLARGTLAHLMTDYYTLRSRAESAMQASQAVDEANLRLGLMRTAQSQLNVQQNQTIIQQNQRLIEQNSRIIKLLEQIAQKRQ